MQGYDTSEFRGTDPESRLLMIFSRLGVKGDKEDKLLASVDTYKTACLRGWGVEGARKELIRAFLTSGITVGPTTTREDTRYILQKVRTCLDEMRPS